MRGVGLRCTGGVHLQAVKLLQDADVRFLPK